MRLGLTIFVFVLSSMVYGINSYANEACGGEIMETKDCSNTDRKDSYKCCNAKGAYRVQGLWYTDKPNKDSADAVGPICRKVNAAGNPEISTGDREGYQGVTLECNPEEVMAGIGYKDLHTDAGGDKDYADGFTIACQNAKTGHIRWLSNQDIDTNPKQLAKRVATLKDGRIRAIVYREAEKGGDRGDRIDCATIAVHPSTSF